MINALSIAGDVFWILALAIMASMSLAAHNRLPAGLSIPVAWRGEMVLVRAPKLAALWLVLALAFAVGAWLKIESRGLDLTLTGAVIWLGVRMTVAPLLAALHISQVRKGLETLEREGEI